jgi:hypothetical protein
MKKKVVKITTLVLVLLAAIVVAVPFLLENKIGDLLKDKVNLSINGTFDFSEARLSLVRSFPNAELRIQDAYLINKAPFEGDTLFSAGEVLLTMSVFELFKDPKDPFQIKKFTLDKATIAVKVDAEENANYDIVMAAEEVSDPTASENAFSLDLQEYAVTNTRITYQDLTSGTLLDVSGINHTGSGDLSAASSELETTTTALVSLTVNNTEYISKSQVALRATLGMNLEESTYTFLKNEGKINQLPLVFDGYVKINEENQEMDIHFETPSSDFNNFLAVLPESYVQEMAEITTSGNFMVEGTIKGILDDVHIPMMNITMQSENAAVKYASMPKTIDNIVINAAVINTSGLAKDTYMVINKGAFSIDEDQFSVDAKIADLLGNTKVDANMQAQMNLANIAKAYPMDGATNLKGNLKGSISTHFDMASIEKKQYQNTQTSGQLSVGNFEVTTEQFKHPIILNSLVIDFKPARVSVREMNGKMGDTDFKITGAINNLLGFLFNKENVEGNFTMVSNTFAVNDFMVDESRVDTTSETSEAIKIPSFLECAIQAQANTVIYDDLALQEVKGLLTIKDETVTVSELTSSLFQGKLAVNGMVSTKNERPAFEMNLGASEFKIGEAFASLELFQILAPAAKALRGTMNTDIKIAGDLKNDFTLDFATITGNVLAELFGTELNPERAQIVSALSNQLQFIKPENVKLDRLKTALSFENGRVQVKPFTVNYQDIAITVSGSHSFDQQLNYTATLDVPAKYLGSEVTTLIAKIDEKELQNLTIPITATIGGMYASPKVQTDLTSGIKSLTTQLVAIQKQKMLAKGKEKASDIIGNVLSGKSKTSDTLGSQTATKNGVQGVLGSILGNTQKQDTVAQDTTTVKKDVVKESAKSILGGLLRKKKQDTVPKDTIN